MQTASRFVIGSSGLTAPARCEVKAGHGYYLGASDSPNYVLVLSVTETTVTYCNAYTLDRRTAQRWIAEDQIATAGATVRRQAHARPTVSTVDRMERHGAAVTFADYDRMTVRLIGLAKADHYGAAQEYGVVSDWDGGTSITVECDGASARELSVDGRFVVARVETLKACPVA